MTYTEWYRTLIPFCHGKKHLIDGIKDIWKSAIPQPQKIKNQVVKMILPKHFEEFTKLCAKENG